VTTPGFFAIDAETLTVRGRVAVEPRDERTPGAAPAPQIAADDSVAATGLYQGDVVLIDPDALSVTSRVGVGRSLQGLCVDGSTTWVVDLVEEALRRVAPDGTVSDALAVDGSPNSLTAAFGSIWLATWTNIINDIGRLYRVDAERVTIEATMHLSGIPEAICATTEHLWVLGTAPRGHHDQNTRRLQSFDAMSVVDDEYETLTLLTALDPVSLGVVMTGLVSGQLHDLVWDGTWLWAVAFSPEDQADCVIRIDPHAGRELGRLMMTDVDVSEYNPPEPLPTSRTSLEFNSAVAAITGEQLRDAGFDAAADLDADTLVVSVREGSRVSRWQAQLRG
jgi:hypothetical protein